MGKVIRVSEPIYKRLESKAKGFDTPSAVIERLLDFYDKFHQKTGTPHGGYEPTSASRTNDAKSRVSSPSSPAIPKKVQDASIFGFEEMTPMAQGNIRRENFKRVAKSKGIHLTKISGVVHRTQNNRIVGIASASESNEKPGTWFLGLPDENYFTVVLLCGKKHCPETFSVIPSNQFISRFIDKLSTDSQGQIKFNIIKTSDNVYMRIPGNDDAEISEFVDNYENLISKPEISGPTASPARLDPVVVVKRRKKPRINDVGGAINKSSFNLDWIAKIDFENDKVTRLRHIYGVLFFMRQGYDFPDATHETLKIFPNVRDYQTISDKCARGFAGSVDNFVTLFKSGKTLTELSEKFNLSYHDHGIFKKLLA